MTETQWDWLGEHLAVDLVNTVRRRGQMTRELLTEPHDLEVWLGFQDRRVPVPETVDARVLEEVLGVRDAALSLLQAGVDHRPLPREDAELVNEIVRQTPIPHLLCDRAGSSVLPLANTGNAKGDLLATLAAAVIDLLGDPDLRDLGFCDAPSCGQYFHRSRPNQLWCCPSCGDRARSARAHRKARE